MKYQGSSSFRQIGRDVLIYTPGKVVPAITGFLGIAAYTRLLDPKDHPFDEQGPHPHGGCLFRSPDLLCYTGDLERGSPEGAAPF